MKDTFIGALDVVQTLSAILVFLIGIGLLVVIVMYSSPRPSSTGAIASVVDAGSASRARGS